MYQESYLKCFTSLIISLLFLTSLLASDCPSTGGNLSLLDGTQHRYVCKKNNSKTIVHLKHSELATDKYVYVITNEDQLILGYSEDRSIDLSNAPRGIYHVWGVSYAGQPQRPMDILISDAEFSKDCFSLSENPVRISYADLIPQRIASQQAEYIAINEFKSSLLSFQTIENTNIDFMYVITNYRRRVVGLTKDKFDFKDFGIGEYQVYGYSYTGEFNIKPGDFMMGAISEGCYEKSENYITVNKMVPAGFNPHETPENPMAHTDAIFAGNNSDELAYETAELPAAEALLFDQDAANLDAKMIEKLAANLAKECNAYAGTLVPDRNQIFYNQENITISATATEAANTDYYTDIQYLLVAEKTGIIEGTALLPAFMISKPGTYHIYPMVANFHHESVAGYFDNNKISLGKTKLERLRQQLASSDFCSDLAGSPATFVVTNTGDKCSVNAGTMQGTETTVPLSASEISITAQHLDTPNIPAGYKKVYLLTWLNQIIEESDTPNFSVNIEGSYGIVCLITKSDILNLRKVKKEVGSSIFQLIEYIDTNGICASVSSWSLTEVTPSNSLSFGPTGTNAVYVVGR